MVYTEAHKRAIYKWRLKNQEKFKDYTNKWATGNYHKNPEKYKEYARRKYKYEREAKIFRNILL